MIVPGSANALLLRATAAYSIPYALRFRASNSAYLSRTFGTPTDNLKFTIRKCVKIGVPASARGTAHFLFAAGDGTSSNHFGVQIRTSDDTLQIRNLAGGVDSLLAYTDMKFRDPSAHYDICIRYDSANATAADRLIVEVNGVRRTLTYTTGPVAQNTAAQANVSGRAHIINSLDFASLYGDWVDSEDFFIDGQALSASNFGEFSAVSGQWVPKKYAGTYGSNGHYLNFADASAATAAAIGKDSSGNGNNWTPSGISVTSGVTFDQLTDTPTNNYATYNALLNGTSYVTTFSEANMSVTKAGGTASPAVSTIGALTGKHYAEFVLATIGTAVLSRVGVTGTNNFYSSTYFIAGEFDPYGVGGNGVGYFANGTRRINNSDTASWGSTYTTSDVIGVAFDADTGKVWFSKNGTWQASGDPAAGTDPAATLTTGVAFWFTHQMLDSQWRGNFGQRPFTYTPPTGFNALNTANLSTPAIPKGSAYFDAITWTGDGAASRNITGFNFNVDLWWSKQRSAVRDNWLVDRVRGATVGIVSNSAAAESTDATAVNAFVDSGSPGASGVTVGNGSSSWIGINANTQTYVAWGFKEGATPGFDIVTYTGNATNRTIAHSLGAVPHFMMVKNRTSATGWTVYHRNMNATPQNGNLTLNSTAAYGAAATSWNSTAPTSSVFSVGTANAVNGNTNNLVNYLWTEIPGFSAFGSYTGNGSADGPFVWCGFKPAFVMIKAASTGTYSWYIIDNKRDPYNVATNELFADSSAAEPAGGAGDVADIVANGFKIRTTRLGVNESGTTFVFAAFAECPFKTATAR